MRTIKELLILLREQVEENLVTGMCVRLTNMAHAGLISNEEWVVINNYLTENKPRNKYCRDTGYFFDVGSKEPRLKWIDERLEEL